MQINFFIFNKWHSEDTLEEAIQDIEDFVEDIKKFKKLLKKYKWWYVISQYIKK